MFGPTVLPRPVELRSDGTPASPVAGVRRRVLTATAKQAFWTSYDLAGRPTPQPYRITGVLFPPVTAGVEWVVDRVAAGMFGPGAAISRFGIDAAATGIDGKPRTYHAGIYAFGPGESIADTLTLLSAMPDGAFETAATFPAGLYLPEGWCLAAFWFYTDSDNPTTTKFRAWVTETVKPGSNGVQL